jgi:hypothetical protein
MRLVIPAALAALLGLLSPHAAPAQHDAPFVVGVGGGGTVYNIVTRLGSGSSVAAMAGYRISPALLVEGSVRRHMCFDCDRFVIAEGGLQLGYPGRRMGPFVSGGYGVSSDPEFMGTESGFYLGVGSWIWATPAWGVQLELRGRKVGASDAMGDATVILARRFNPF